MNKYLKNFTADLEGNLLTVYYTNCHYDKSISKYSYTIDDIEVAVSDELLKDELLVRKLSFEDLFWKGIKDFEDLMSRILFLVAIPVFGSILLILFVLLIKSFFSEAL